MGIINQEVFVEQYVRNDSLRRMCSGAIGASEPESVDLTNRDRRPWWNAPLNRESALECFAAIRDYVRARGYYSGKALRPWEIDPGLYSRLDRSEPWWGFEFETGYRSPQARGAVVTHVWDTWDNMCFDAEGEGSAAVEITFAPQERSKFSDGTASALQFMQFLGSSAHLTERGGSNSVGTHLNVSVPGMDSTNVSVMCDAMNMTLGALPVELDGMGNLRLHLFGRASLYGGFFSQNQGNSAWLEGKLFRTTYDMPTFNRYIQSCDALTRCLTALVAAATDTEQQWHIQLSHVPYVTNLWEMFRDNVEPELQWADANNKTHMRVWNGCTHRNTTPQTRADYEVILAEMEQARLRKEAFEREKEERRMNAFTRLAERRAARARGERPDYVPEEGDGALNSEWCDDCQDWHYDGDDTELFDDPTYLHATQVNAA